MTLGDAFRPPKPVRKPRPKKPAEWGSAFEPVVKQKPAPKPKR